MTNAKYLSLLLAALSSTCLVLFFQETSEPSLVQFTVEFSSDTLDLLNHAVNFLLYIVSGSRFRKEVCVRLCACARVLVCVCERV